MRLLINAAAVKSEGGMTLLKNILIQFFHYNQQDLQIWLCVNETGLEKLNGLQDSFPDLTVIRCQQESKGWGLCKRFFWEQIILPRWVRDYKIDLLLSFANTGPLFPGCEQVLYIQQSLPYADFTPIYKRIHWRLFCASFAILIGLAQLGSKRIIVHTSWLIQPMRRSVLGLVPKDRYRVSAPGLPMIEDIQPLTGTENNLIEHMKSRKREGHSILFYPCFLAPYKNLPALLDVISNDLIEQTIEKPLTLVLTFNENSSEYFPCKTTIFEQLNSSKQLSSRIILAGTLSKDAVSSMYELTDLLLFPSQVETLGLPLIEALNQEIPILAEDTAFAREVCQDDAIYTNFKDIAGTVFALKEALNEKSGYLFNKESLSERFSWEKHIKAILNDSEIKSLTLVDSQDPISIL